MNVTPRTHTRTEPPAPPPCSGVSDLERAITRLHASTVEGGSGRDAANVVLYEDAAKRKVRV